MAAPAINEKVFQRTMGSTVVRETGTDEGMKPQLMTVSNG
jgi:hypothetical protein